MDRSEVWEMGAEYDVLKDSLFVGGGGQNGSKAGEMKQR